MDRRVSFKVASPCFEMGTT